MKGDNCNSTYLNSRPKGNRNIDHNRIVLANFFWGIIASMLLWNDNTQIVLVGSNAITNKIIEV